MTVSDSIFRNNSAGAGGGIVNEYDAHDHGWPTAFSPVTPLSNVTGSGHGGGIYNQDGGTLTVIHSIFNGNSAYAVGGFYNVGTLTVKDSTITNNSAISFAGTPGYTASPWCCWWILQYRSAERRGRGDPRRTKPPNGGVGRPPPNETNSQRKQSRSEGGQHQLCSMPGRPRLRCQRVFTVRRSSG